MKKALLTISITIGLALCQASAQTISLTGTNGIINAGDTFTSHITLSITGTNSIGDVESVNFLLGTPNSGANSGSGYFTITALTPTSPFDTANAGPTAVPATFTVTGTAANSGSNISSSADLGVNAPAMSAMSVAGTGTTAFEVETLAFTSMGSTPAGVYDFYVTSGGYSDIQGSYISNSLDQSFDIGSTPTFTITIEAVPEPSTWVMGLLSVGFVGYTALRRPRHYHLSQTI